MQNITPHTSTHFPTSCNALYGVMMLRMAKKPVSEGTETAAKEISSVMAMLAAYYKQNKKEPLSFDGANGNS